MLAYFLIIKFNSAEKHMANGKKKEVRKDVQKHSQGCISFREIGP